MKLPCNLMIAAVADDLTCAIVMTCHPVADVPAGWEVLDLGEAESKAVAA